MSEATPEQVALLYARRADAENVFDELKNQWGFRGFCSGRAVVTETVEVVPVPQFGMVQALREEFQKFRLNPGPYAPRQTRVTLIWSPFGFSAARTDWPPKELPRERKDRFARCEPTLI